VKITGKFGYASSVPADISLVATKLVAGIIEERGLRGIGITKSEKLGEYSVTFEDIEKIASKLDVYKILDKYRKISL